MRLVCEHGACGAAVVRDADAEEMVDEDKEGDALCACSVSSEPIK